MDEPPGGKGPGPEPQAAEESRAAEEALGEEVRAAIAARRPPWFSPEDGETVLAPQSGGRGHWVGAPSVLVEEAGSRVLLSYRRRRPRDGSADERGYLAAVAESSDGGRTFTDIWHLTKNEVATSSIERFSLRRGSEGGYLLYTSWEDPPSSGRWRIDVLRADSPDAFSLDSAMPVLSPDDLGVDAVKDPVVVTRGDEVVMYASTFLTPAGPAPTSVATSRDGTAFVPVGMALGVGAGWDAYQARLSSVLPFGHGHVGYYDGGASRDEDTEERCGIAVSVDLVHWRSVSTQQPAIVSPYASGSLRYVEVVTIGDTPYAYYEYTRPDGAHELRRSELRAR